MSLNMEGNNGRHCTTGTGLYKVDERAALRLYFDQEHQEHFALCAERELTPD
jgi:hypothetical protein